MDTRTASYLSLFTAPAAYLLCLMTHDPILAMIALACVAGALVLGIVTCIRAGRASDRRSRAISIGGISLNALYLCLVFLAIFVIAPKLRADAAKLLQEAQQQTPSQ